MTTITAVELRKNLEDIIKRAMAGETFRVTYRQRPAIKISTDVPESTPPRMSGLDAFLAAPRKKSTLDPNKSFKELYHEHLEEKYGKYTK